MLVERLLYLDLNIDEESSGASEERARELDQLLVSPEEGLLNDVVEVLSALKYQNFASNEARQAAHERCDLLLSVCSIREIGDKFMVKRIEVTIGGKLDDDHITSPA